jgi:hypothetical protein
MEVTGCCGEQPSSLVDPDAKTRVACGGNKIGIAIAIHVGDNKSDDQVGVVPRIGVRRIREQQRRKRTERRENQSAYGENRCVDDACPFKDRATSTTSL